MHPTINTVAVIGAGQMGSGIAQMLAQSGYRTILNDVSEEALARGHLIIEATLSKQLSRDKISEEQMVSALQAIRPTLDISENG